MLYFHGDFSPCSKLTGDSILQDGIRIGNLEAAFSDELPSSGKAYTSVLSKSCIDYIGDFGFHALSLANNHSYDAGNFTSMLTLLCRQYPDIQFFGSRKRPYAEFKVANEKIAIIGCLERCRSRGSELFPEEEVLSLLLKIRANYSLVYIYPHWGKESEYTRLPSPRQIHLAHIWIEAGADGIWGHHSHLFQGREIYKGKPIYYSLGNFFFPHQEGDLYEGTNIGLSVEVESNQCTEYFHSFDRRNIRKADDRANENLLNLISQKLVSLTYWQWAKTIGPFYFKKNFASWKIRFHKKPLKTLCLYMIWNLRPLNLFLRYASFFQEGK